MRVAMGAVRKATSDAAMAGGQAYMQAGLERSGAAVQPHGEHQ